MTPPSSTTVAHAGRVKACHACRQLKLRCDAAEYNYRSCSRCQKMGRDCVIAVSSRPRTRKTKADLEREVDMLRAQFGSPPISAASTRLADHPAHTVAPTNDWDQALLQQLAPGLDDQLRVLTATPENGSTDVERDSLGRPTVSQVPSQTSPVEATHSSTYFATGTNSTPYQPAGLGSYASDTLPRTIDDKRIDSRNIDGCFSAFFKWYAPTLQGVFDSFESPNVLYDYSDFLFWTIIHVGSRKYGRDPTIVQSLTQPLELLAQRSLFEPDNAIPSIQAALLLCLWPLPINTDFRSRTHAIAGAAMQLAIQKGMPFSSRKQDFLRIPVTLSQADNMFRARLWAYCVTVFQSNSIFDGFPCTMFPDPNNFGRDLSPLHGLPSTIVYKCRLHRVLTDSFSLILSSTNLLTDKNSDSLNSLLCHFDSEAQSVSCLENDNLDRFTLGSVRLLIRAFHFFSAPTGQRTTGILQTYYIACELIETASRLDKELEFGHYSDRNQLRAVSLAAMVILRVLRSTLSLQVNAEMGEAMYFEAIRLSKMHSVLNDDLDARNAIILSQLWSSTRTFQFKDGSVDGLRLLLRARLSMSVFFDAHWWWRAEFGGRSNPYLESETSQMAPMDPETVTQSTVDNQMSDDQDNMTAAFTTMLPVASSDALLPDWDWGELGDVGFDWY
ncbi:hypothetical protein BR93DRAFT_932662 [Coniochaeta sp. PMI_546]|nr:hypothetical protein BR93DRAFT_932662 [Coniochaeta sp. PMI_546]